MRRAIRLPGPPLLAGACALALAGCAGDPAQERLEGRDAPPAAALVSPMRETASLDAQLQQLRVELAAGMQGDPDRILRAEAITDGLMEARRPFDWLATGYDLEARLRQLQAMADRVVARLRRGADLGDIAEDVDAMTMALTDLRTQLASGRGGPAPPTLDSLLARDPREAARGRGAGVAGAVPAGAETPETANEPEPEEEDEDRPLGTPVGG